MKISFIGSRGIPACYGGFETFTEELSQKLTAMGYEVYVQCDMSGSGIYKSGDVGLFYSTVTKSHKPLRYFYEGIKWGVKHSDIIVVMGSPGSVFYFLNIFRKKVIITNTDGIESKRAKWSFFHRSFLKCTEFLAVLLSDWIIADSVGIKHYLLGAYPVPGKKIRVIEYGAYLNDSFDESVLRKYNLVRDGFYLVVSRIEPENNLKMIIEGYLKSNVLKPLVVVGHLLDNNYVKSLIDSCKSDRIVFTGGIYNKKELNSLRYSCKAYIHGHSVGGTNPSLLEAMGNRNITICHDNIFNREVTDNMQFYFRDFKECSQRIGQVEELNREEIESYRGKAAARISEYYSWDNIVKKYSDLFSEIVPGEQKKQFSE